jgi:NitT/TauT family transport system ATP-binding protein
MNAAVAGPAGEAWIRVRDLSFTFDDGTVALDGVSADVARGELVCLVGPSGCGKSTLLNVITGFLKHARGEVLVDGAPVRGPDRRRICVVQESALFPWLTVAENVDFALADQDQAARRETVRFYLALVGLAEFAHARPAQLSGGMRQRAEIARALAAGGDTLYLDEPFAALDYANRLRLRRDLLGWWKAAERTILFVTHDIDEALQLGDRVLVMSRRPGRIVAEIPVEVRRPRRPHAPELASLRAAIQSLLGDD